MGWDVSGVAREGDEIIERDYALLIFIQHSVGEGPGVLLICTMGS